MKHEVLYGLSWVSAGLGAALLVLAAWMAAGL